MIAGSALGITWEATGSGIDHVVLRYSTDEGATWKSIDDPLPTVGTYDWVVPSGLPGEILIEATVSKADGEFLAGDSRGISIWGAGP